MGGRAAGFDPSSSDKKRMGHEKKPETTNVPADNNNGVPEQKHKGFKKRDKKF